MRLKLVGVARASPFIGERCWSCGAGVVLTAEAFRRKRRRIDECCPASHHLGEKSAGDGPERQSMVRVAEGKPEVRVTPAFADNRQHVRRAGASLGNADG